MTILELVAAIVLLGITVPPVLHFFAESLQKSLRPERQTQASFLAAEKMEEIVADRHSTDRGYEYLKNAHYPEEELENGFSRTVSCTEVSSSDLSTSDDGSGYLKVVVTVQPGDETGGAQLTHLFCDLSYTDAGQEEQDTTEEDSEFPRLRRQRRIQEAQPFF